MPRTFEPLALADRLARLPSALQIAYALLIAERLYPALAAYSRETGGEEAWRLREYLNEIWEGLERGTLMVDRLHTVANEVFELRPETEDNPSLLSSYALDAAAAAWEAIQAAITRDPSHVVAAAQIAFDSIYLNQEEREDFSPQDQADQLAILTREPVVKELETQERQLRRAELFRGNPQEAVRLLRQEYGHPDKSIHGLS